MVFRKSSIGDAQGKLPVPVLRVDYAVGIIPAVRFLLKAEILDLYLRGTILVLGIAPARAVCRFPSAGRKRSLSRA